MLYLILKAFLLISAFCYTVISSLLYWVVNKNNQLSFTRLSCMLVALIAPVLLLLVIILPKKYTRKLGGFLDKALPLHQKDDKKDDDILGI